MDQRFSGQLPLTYWLCSCCLVLARSSRSAEEPFGCFRNCPGEISPTSWGCEKIRPVRAPGFQQRLQLLANQWRRRALTPLLQRILNFFTAPLRIGGRAD